MFKSKREQIEGNADWTDKAAGKIASAGLRLQEKFAKVMGKLFSKNVRAFFIVFCLSAGGYSMYLIGQALFGTPVTQPVIHIEQATIPGHIDDADNGIKGTDQYVDDATYQQLLGFKAFMDSLKDRRSKLYDSIITSRPGLMDSTKTLIELYKQQKK